MKYLATLLLIFGFGLSAFGQTIKSLGYNTTNGQIVVATNVIWTNSFNFSTNTVADSVRANLGFSTNLNTLWTSTSASNARSAVNVAPAPIFKVLTNDFSITNQTNMTVVVDLTIATEANKSYIVELFPILSASLANTVLNIVSSNATVYGFWDIFSTGSYTTNALTNNQSAGITSARAIAQKFYVKANTNTGSISFQFSSSVATNTNTIGAGSYMMAQEMLVTP